MGDVQIGGGLNKIGNGFVKAVINSFPAVYLKLQYGFSWVTVVKKDSPPDSPIPCTRKVSAAGSSLFKTVTKL